MAVETINDVLQKRNVTVSEMTSVLRTKAGLDAIATEITGLGGSARYQAITLQDDSARLSIKKKAYSLADGTIGVQDDVDVAFLLHSA